MSYFYAGIPESARKTIPTARGHTSIAAYVKSWDVQIDVRLTKELEQDCYEISITNLKTGSGRVLSHGLVSDLIGK